MTAWPGCWHRKTERERESTINHSHKTETAVKTANTKKKGRPKKVVKADPEPAPSDDILDDPEMADIGAHIFGEDNRNE